VRCSSLAMASHCARALMSNLLRILLAILLPSVDVFLTVGFGGQFWLNILLTIFGYIPVSSTLSGLLRGAPRESTGRKLVEAIRRGAYA
jgi:uncharacterized membrane protein YqaE (UPF0057 family)